MLDAKIIKLIVRLYYNKKSEYQIARALEISKNTVVKYIKKYSFIIDELSCDEIRNNYLIEKYIITPEYNSSKRKPRSYTEEDVSFINTLLQEEFQRRRDGKEPRSRTELYSIVRENGFQASYSTFTRILKKDFSI